MSGPALVIAEAGVNHNGDIGLAKKLIEVAAQAGADLVKFQTFRAADLATCAAQTAAYQKAAIGDQYSQLEMLQRLELSAEDHQILIDHCEEEGIGFFSTAFDATSIELLRSLGQRLFKIPSGEITNLPYLRHIGRMGKEVILSSGMATLRELEDAIEVLERSGTPRSDITVLHCTSEYPAPMEDVNLRAMQSIQKALGVAVGYSDHTLGIEIAIAAVAMGASVIEKHITLDRELPGPDHKASLEPAELREMIKSIRNLEMALGDGVKVPSVGEMSNREIARKSLVASREIKAGDFFSEENLTAKRPGTGISPMRWDEIIGARSPRDFSENELIEL
jgi:N,N'-diacetyllegionaminate synthase